MRKVVFLTRAGGVGHALAHEIHATLPLSGIVVYEPRASNRLVVRIRWSRLYRALALLKKPPLERKIARLDQKLRREASALFLRHYEAQAKGFPPGVPRVEVDDVNGDRMQNYLLAEHPDLVLVCAVPILKPHIFEIPRCGVLNAHFSLLPAYRGAAPEFWQILNGDTGRAGITIHRIDAGVDTGPLLYRQPVTAPAGADQWVLRACNVMALLESYGRVARDYLEGRLSPVPQEQTGTSVFRGRDLTTSHEVAYYRKLGYDL